MPVSNVLIPVFGSIFNSGSYSASASSFYDFTLGSLPSGVSLTRASAGYRYNSAGLLVSETTDVARFQYDPATLAARGLLIEEARTNLCLRSETLDHATWTKTGGLTVTADAAVAPDGATTMDRVTPGLTAGPAIYRTYASTAAVYTNSAFVKAVGGRWIGLGFGSGTLADGAFFDLQNGVVGVVAAGATATIRSLGGGMYRIAVARLLSAGTSYVDVEPHSTDNQSSGWTSSAGAETFLVWGAQGELGDTLNSYIPTSTAATVRAEDVALITNTQVLGDQCYILKARTPRKISGGAVNVLLHVDDGTNNNNNRRIVYGTDGRIHVIATSGGVDQCDLDLGAVAADTDFAVAARFADNNFAASLNGGAIVTDLSGTNPIGLSTARLGRRSDGYAWNSTVRTFKHQSTATDAELPLLAA